MINMLELTRLPARPVPLERRETRSNGIDTDAAERISEKASPEKEKRDFPPRVDQYVPSEPSDPAGIYRVSPDEDGTRKVIFDAPVEEKEKNAEKAAPEKAEANAPESSKKAGDKKTEGKKSDGKKAESCTGNTDKVDREIERLKKKQKMLEQKIAQTSDRPDERARLEQQLKQVKQELSVKDTDTYRRQHSVFS